MWATAWSRFRLMPRQRLSFLRRFFGAETVVKDADNLLRGEEVHKCLALSSQCSRSLASKPGTVNSSAPSAGISTLTATDKRTMAAAAAAEHSLSEGQISFHGRTLPSHLISLESAEGQQLFAEAFQRGHATNFFPLITNFASQSDVSMCGPASLAMVLNALRLDPRRTWKSPWRWWSDEMFACCESSLKSMKSSGVTLQLFDRIARAQKELLVSTRHPQSLSEFQEALNRCATESATHIIVSFSREALGQTGIGHFSPVAAVHLERGLVLILDVARFKYPPYWVRAESLYEAMRVVDPSTNMSRGYCVLSRHTSGT